MPLEEAEGPHLTFGSAPATSMVVSWITRGPVHTPRVEYQPDHEDQPDHESGSGDGAGTNRWLTAPAETRSYTDAVTGEEIFVHHARLESLAPDTAYRYAIAQGRRTGIETGEFRTAPESRAPFTFTCFGDHGSNAPDDPYGSPASGTLVDCIERIAPLFTIVNGDLAYSNIRDVPPKAWSDWFRMIRPSATRRPWMPSVGNHETERGNGALGLSAYQTYFELPDNGEDAYLAGLWYGFTVGSVRFLSLAGDDVCHQDAGRVYLRGFSSGRQTAWLDQELKQARSDPTIDWIVVYLHAPAVSTSEFHNGADLGLREEWLPLFDSHGVDLVLYGHEHHYERTHPVRGVVEGSGTRTPRPVPEATLARDPDLLDTSAGTVHLVLGTGGSSSPSAEALFDPPACRIVVGVEKPTAHWRHRRAIRKVEDAPWSAHRAPEHPYAFAAFNVDPGEPGGNTAMRVTVYDSSTSVPAAFDTFALVRPRTDVPT